MLVAAAAQQWNVPASECTVANGVIAHSGSKRRTSFGKVAAAASKMEAPKDAAVKDPKDWTIAGQPLHRLDIPDKVRGKPVFGVDVVLPGMLMASIVQCPVFLGKVKSVDTSAIENLRGVKGAVKGEDFVAVVADNWWRANEAAKKLKIEWDEGQYANASDATIMASFREGLEAKDLASAQKVGEGAAALASAAKVMEAEYSSPYLAHATMEPMTATAWFKDDGTLDVWTSTQNAEASIATAAETSGLPLEKVEVHKALLGGGFGRRGAPQDYVKQAVIIAKQFPGKPVKMIWSREEDMQHGFYRPASLVRMKAGLDAQGNLVAFHSVVACPSILALLRPEAIKNGVDFSAVRTLSDAPYTVPNVQCDYAMRNGHVPVGFWRAPGLQNAYYRECFLDEVAHATGKDPVEFRLAMLKAGDKNRGVLEAVAKAAELGLAAARGCLSRRGGIRRVRQLHRDGGRGEREGRRGAGASPRVRHRLGLRRESRRMPRAGRGQRGLQPGAALPEAHHQGRAHRRVQLPRLRASAHAHGAEGGRGARAHRRLLGRPRRAGRALRDALGDERRVRRHRQAHPLATLEGRRPQGVTPSKWGQVNSILSPSETVGDRIENVT